MLDAAVAVAALRTQEPAHVAALQYCRGFFAGADQIIVPAIFDVEVVSALIRRGASAPRVNALFERHFQSRRLVTLGPRAVTGARGVVSATRLRAADATYVWLAARESLPLITLDQEILARAALAGVTATLP